MLRVPFMHYFTCHSSILMALSSCSRRVSKCMACDSGLFRLMAVAWCWCLWMWPKWVLNYKKKNSGHLVPNKTKQKTKASHAYCTQHTQISSFQTSEWVCSFTCQSFVNKTNLIQVTLFYIDLKHTENCFLSQFMFHFLETSIFFFPQKTLQAQNL